jgi:hypothetical protein
MSTSRPTSAASVEVRIFPSLLKTRTLSIPGWAPMLSIMRWRPSRSSRSMASRVERRIVSAMRSADRLTSRVRWARWRWMFQVPARRRMTAAPAHSEAPIRKARRRASGRRPASSVMMPSVMRG